jgi:hypothetical protein
VSAIASSLALVVVHEVEVVRPLGQQPGDPHGERPRLGEARRPHRQQFQQVNRVADLAGTRHPERVGLAVEIQAGHLGQPHPRIEQFRIGLAGEDLDVVAEVDQSAAEMAHVDALSAAMVLTAIGQQGNSHTQLLSADGRTRTTAP